MSAQVERTALVDRGHDPEIVRKVTVADLSADPDGQLLEQVRAKLVLHRDQRLVWLRLLGALEERVARCVVGKNRVDRVSSARSDARDLLPVRPAPEQDLLDRQDLT